MRVTASVTGIISTLSCAIESTTRKEPLPQLGSQPLGSTHGDYSFTGQEDSAGSRHNQVGLSDHNAPLRAEAAGAYPFPARCDVGDVCGLVSLRSSRDRLVIVGRTSRVPTWRLHCFRPEASVRLLGILPVRS